MLKSKTIDCDTAPVPWAAVKDAQMRNAIGITHFSPKEQIKANAMMYALQLCYHSDATHINWRDGGTAGRPKFAAIKLENPILADRKKLNTLEDGWKTDTDLTRITKRVTAQGIIWRAYF